MSHIKKIGVLTSGGDAPGMNAALRAVIRSAIYKGLEVVAVNRGYNGMVEGDFRNMIKSDVSNIIQQGGTILKSARSDKFRDKEGRKKAFENLQKEGVDALIVIGGDGTFTGASIFAEEFNVPVIGIPGTIDNDLYGTDVTIGYDTALNTIVEAVDKIRDTASSHERLFIIEVMGRDAGFLALNGGIAGGAEAVLIPELQSDEDCFRDFLNNADKRSKTSSIILVAEGDQIGGAIGAAEVVKNEFPQYDARVTILGHLQRGGTPTAMDRVVASRMGVASIEALLEGQRNVMVGIKNNEIVYVPLSRAIKNTKKIEAGLFELIAILSA